MVSINRLQRTYFNKLCLGDIYRLIFKKLIYKLGLILLRNYLNDEAQFVKLNNTESKFNNN